MMRTDEEDAVRQRGRGADEAATIRMERLVFQVPTPNLAPALTLFKGESHSISFRPRSCSQNCGWVGWKEDQSVLDISLDGERFRQSSYADRRVK
jgi:hypothetical protein